jgi:hypothetical protein
MMMMESCPSHGDIHTYCTMGISGRRTDCSGAAAVAKYCRIHIGRTISKRFVFSSRSPTPVHLVSPSLPKWPRRFAGRGTFGTSARYYNLLLMISLALRHFMSSRLKPTCLPARPRLRIRNRHHADRAMARECVCVCV